MKKVILFTVAAFFGMQAKTNAQILNQDATGKSSIITSGTSINLNISETQIQASHYGFLGKKASWLYGFDVAANNSSGVGTLFDKDKITPGGAFSGIFGYRWVDVESKNLFDNEVYLSKNIADIQKEFGQAYLALVLSEVNGSNLQAINKKTVTRELQNLDKLGLDNLDDALNNFTSLVKDTAEMTKIVKVVKNLQVFVQQHQDEVNNLINLVEKKKSAELPKLLRNATTTLYARGGFKATDFTYDQGNTFVSYDTRFIDKTSDSWYVEAGLSRQFKMNFIGVNIGYSRLDNFSNLTSSDFNYEGQDTTLKSGKLTEKKTVTAYSGDYGHFEKIYINVDYQHLFKVDTSKYVAVGPFVRWNHLWGAGDLAKAATVFGGSLNYINGKAGTFLGGIYVQNSDLLNKSGMELKKRIQFGIVAKFSLQTLFTMK